MHPVAPRPADRLPADAARDRGARLARSGGDGDAGRARLAAVRAQVQALDQAVFDAVAVTPTPDLDRYLARLSSAANYSRLLLLVAAGMAAVGGVRGRRAAGLGVLAIGAASAVSNLALKPLARRRRPVHTGGDRPPAGVAGGDGTVSAGTRRTWSRACATSCVGMAARVGRRLASSPGRPVRSTCTAGLGVFRPGSTGSPGCWASPSGARSGRESCASCCPGSDPVSPRNRHPGTGRNTPGRRGRSGVRRTVGRRRAPAGGAAP